MTPSCLCWLHVRALAQAAVDLDAKITFLLDCHAPEAKEVQVQVRRHRDDDDDDDD